MNVLFLTHRLPYAPNRGDRIRAYHLMREMSRFTRVSLFSFVHDDDEAAHAAEVPFAQTVRTARVPRARNFVRGALGLPSSRPLTHSLLHAPEARQLLTELVHSHPPDLVFAYCSGMARLALEPPLDTFPLVVDFVDIDSVKWLSLSERAAVPRRWVFEREARTLAKFEALAAERAKAVFVVNERERRRAARTHACGPRQRRRKRDRRHRIRQSGAALGIAGGRFLWRDGLPAERARRRLVRGACLAPRAGRAAAARFVIVGRESEQNRAGTRCARSLHRDYGTHRFGAAAPLARRSRGRTSTSWPEASRTKCWKRWRPDFPTSLRLPCATAFRPAPNEGARSQTIRTRWRDAVVDLLKQPADARRSMAMAGA